MAFDGNREARHVAPRQRAAEPLLDAGQTKVVILPESEVAFPDFRTDHAVVARLDDVHAAVLAAVARDLAAREFAGYHW